MHQEPTLMRVRTTLIIDDALIDKARRITGLVENTSLVHEGLRALIARESARKIVALEAPSAGCARLGGGGRRRLDDRVDSS